MDQLTETELGGKKRNAPDTPTMPAKKAKADNKKPAQKSEEKKPIQKDEGKKSAKNLLQKRRDAPVTPTTPAKKAKADNKKPAQKSEEKKPIQKDEGKESAKNNQQQKSEKLDNAAEINDDEAKFMCTQMRLFSEGMKLIENNRREDIQKLYEDEIKELNYEQQEILRKDGDELTEMYYFDFAKHRADSQKGKGTIGYEYYYVKAARLNPSFNPPCISDAFNEKNKKLEDMTTKLDHYKQYTNEPNNQVEQINATRFYALVQNTVAIEGNKFTLDDVERFLTTEELIPERSQHDHDEVTDAASAIKFADEQIIPNDSHITLETILNLHKKVMKTTKPDCCGELRKKQVFVGDHRPPKHDDVPDLMSAFIESLNQKTDSHVIEVAAHVHNEFVRIHPFVDGNGRIGRLLMNIALQRNGFPAIEIPFDRRSVYYDCLRMSHDGYHVAFIEFIADCVGRALNEYLKP